ASISGKVFADANGDGRPQRGENGLGGRVVQLLGLDGAVLATAMTGFDGSYRFDGLDLGSYQVREVLPPGKKASNQPPPIDITRGMCVNGVNLGEAPLVTSSSRWRLRRVPAKPPAAS